MATEQAMNAAKKCEFARGYKRGIGDTIAWIKEYRLEPEETLTESEYKKELITFIRRQQGIKK